MREAAPDSFWDLIMGLYEWRRCQDARHTAPPHRVNLFFPLPDQTRWGPRKPLAWASPIPHVHTQGLPTPSLPSFLATAASFSESTSPKPTPLSSRTWAANWREHRDGISSGAPSHPVPISCFPEWSLGTWGREELPLARHRAPGNLRFPTRPPLGCGSVSAPGHGCSWAWSFRRCSARRVRDTSMLPGMLGSLTSEQLRPFLLWG